MRPYQVVAFLIALGVVFQAAAIALAVFGLGPWIEGGGVLDKATLESDAGTYPEVVGFMLHGIGGTIVVPALGLALLVISFFARVPRGIAWAGAVLGLIVLQVTLGMLGHGLPALGPLHGMNAFLVFSVAAWAGLRAGRAPAGAVAVA